MVIARGWAVAERGEESWAARRPVEVAREGLDIGLDRPVGAWLGWAVVTSRTAGWRNRPDSELLFDE